MKICLATDTFLPEVNGVTTVLATMRDGLRERGHEVLVLAPAYGQSTSDESGILRRRLEHEGLGPVLSGHEGRQGRPEVIDGIDLGGVDDDRRPLRGRRWLVVDLAEGVARGAGPGVTTTGPAAVVADRHDDEHEQGDGNDADADGEVSQPLRSHDGNAIAPLLRGTYPRTMSDANDQIPSGEIVPDDKDWTWTLTRPCPECGFEASAVGPELVPGSIAVLTRPWAKVLARADVRDRPAPGVWSALEYACHVRDVCALFAERTRLMLTEQSPRFANWDQDATAIEKSYRRADPDVVAGELAAAAQAYVESYAGVSGEQWDRPGVRSNGSEFTVLTLGQYGLHDLAHHLWDVRAAH